MLHICFSDSGAGTLRWTLRNERRSERVLTLADDLSFGPVREVTGLRRKEWHASSGIWEPDHLEELWSAASEFWKCIDTPQDDLTVWYTRRSTLEYCGFLELLSRIPPSAMLHCVDLTDLRLEDSGWKVISTGILNEQQLRRGFDLMQPVLSALCLAEIALWRRLKEDDAPARRLVGGQLISAGADCHDNEILDHVGIAWSKASRVIGEILGHHWELSQTAEFGDGWILARLHALKSQGEIEMRGGPDIRGMQIRQANVSSKFKF